MEKGEISSSLLSSFQQEYQNKKENSVKECSVSRVGIKEACTNPYLPRTLVPAFSLEVEGGKPTNQMRSGRCWMFAATNVRRFEVRKNLNIKNRELSQNYPLFFDKLEKSNFFLRNILDTLSLPLSSRLVSFLLKDPIDDGGQWDRFVSLTEKYGICPKEARPETYSSSHTADLDKYITLKLRKDANVLRSSFEQGSTLDELLSRKEKRLNEIFSRLVICLGKPPVEFDYEYYEKQMPKGKESSIPFIRLRKNSTKNMLRGTFRIMFLLSTLLRKTNLIGIPLLSSILAMSLVERRYVILIFPSRN